MTEWKLDPKQAAEMVAQAEEVRDHPERGPLNFLDGLTPFAAFFIQYILETGMAKEARLTYDNKILVVDAEWDVATGTDEITDMGLAWCANCARYLNPYEREDHENMKHRIR